MGSEWRTLSLADAGVILIDCDHRTPAAVEEGMPYVGIPQMKNGRIEIETSRLISEEDFKEWRRKAEPTQHDIVLSRRCNPGVTAPVLDVTDFALGQNLVLLRSEGAQLAPEFLTWLTRGPDWWAQIQKYLNVGAVFDSLKCADIPKFEVSIPSHSAQRRIAHILGTLDGKIELNRRTNQTLESIARALFKSWFIDFDPVHAKAAGHPPPNLDPATAALFPNTFEDSELGKIPTGWEASRLGEVIEIFDSKRIPLSKKQRSTRQGLYPYYGAAAVMDHVDDYLFEGVYVLMGEDGSVLQADETPVLQYVWDKFWVNNHAHVLLGTNGIATEHILLYLKTVNIQPYVTGAVQMKLNQGNLKRIPFILPTKPTAAAFQAKIEPLFERVRANVEQSRTLATLRDTLLPKLLSGELDVSNLNQEAHHAI